MFKERWIRRDRENGAISEISGWELRKMLAHHYTDVDAAMGAASENSPLTTGFADYWPKIYTEEGANV